MMGTTAHVANTPPRIPDVNIASPEFNANPFGYYKLLRDDAPVHPITLPDKRTTWLVTRYDDVNVLLRDERFVKNPRIVPRAAGEPPVKEQWIPGFIKPLRDNMLDLDGAEHSRLRGLAHHAFTPKLVEQLRGQVQRICDELLDRALAKGRMDLVHDFALPLPVTVIAMLLGIPQKDQDKFHRWSQALVGIAGSIDTLVTIPKLWQFMRYLRQFIRDKQTHPGEDLTTALLQTDDAGNMLGEDERTPTAHHAPTSICRTGTAARSTGCSTPT